MVPSCCLIHRSSASRAAKSRLSGVPAVSRFGSDVPTIQKNLCVDYPPFGTEIPDQYRVDIFLKEFNQYVANGSLPTLTYLWLCDDHTSGISAGFPTPVAQVASMNQHELVTRPLRLLFTNTPNYTPHSVLPANHPAEPADAGDSVYDQQNPTGLGKRVSSNVRSTAKSRFRRSGTPEPRHLVFHKGIQHAVSATRQSSFPAKSNVLGTGIRMTIDAESGSFG